MKDLPKLKNYTSGVPVIQTIARIEDRLSSIGANSITKIYGPDREVSALLFNIELGERRYVIRLPANVDACFDALWKEYSQHVSRVHPSAKERIKEQSARTAWKVMQDWVDIQVTLIVLQQADWMQIFMSFVYDPRTQQTVYETFKEDSFKGLPYNVAPVRQLKEVNESHSR